MLKSEQQWKSLNCNVNFPFRFNCKKAYIMLESFVRSSFQCVMVILYFILSFQNIFD